MADFVGSQYTIDEIKDAMSSQTTTINNSITTKGIVKSVQRGSTAFSGTSTSMDITISSVNTSKSLVFATSAFSFNPFISISAKLSSSTKITVYRGNNAMSGNVEWQVVEFY